MAVTVRDLVRPQGNELLDRIPGWNCPFQFLVLRQKLNFSLCHLYETTLSDTFSVGSATRAREATAPT
jgi:hypothetical protein